MIRIRIVQESHGIHERSKSFYPGPTADYDTVCRLMTQLGFKSSSKTKKPLFERLRLKK